MLPSERVAQSRGGREPSARAPGDVRVLRLFSRLNIGGPSIHVILLTAGLALRGYKTRLVVGQESATEGNMLPLAAEKGVVCEILPALGREIRPLSDLRAFLALLRLIKEFRPAIVHTHAAKAGLLGRVAARMAGVPVVVHTFHGHVLRGYFGRARTAFYRALEALLARATDAVVAVSEAVRDDLADLGVAPHDRIRVVPLGLELTALAGELPRGVLRRDLGVSDQAPLVGLVGRLVPIKDAPTFLEAASLIHQERPDVRFVLVGDGTERFLLETQVQTLGLSGIVSFAGWRRDLAAVYGDLSVVVNASRNEGTPVALIEALAAACPVVATRVGGTPDVLAGGEYGRLVPPADPRALADAILETLANSAASRDRALAGQKHVLVHHSVERLLDDMDGLYRELLAKRSQAA
jgi:glycosyltransferase involved in cell wall biosynthesis